MDGNRQRDKEPRVRFRRTGRPRSKFGSITHIILLSAAFAIIIWLIFYLKDSSLFGGDGEGEDDNIPVVRGSGLEIDENLINYYDEGIRLLRPDRNWEFAYGTSLQYEEVDAFSEAIWLNATEICRLTRYDADRPVVRVRVGKLELLEPRTSNSLAHQSFENIMLYALDPEHPYNVDTWEPTTTLDSGDMSGTYYVIKVTHSRDTQADIRVVAFFVRDEYVYTMMGEVSYEEYDIYREKIRYIFNHFVFI